MSGDTKDLLIDHIVTIANALCGEEDSYSGTDLLRHHLGRIADFFEENEIATGASLPEVKATDEGKVLVVDSNGKWVAGTVG